MGTAMKNRIADYLPAAFRRTRGRPGEEGTLADLRRLTQPVERLVSKYPAAALAAAFAAGVALAWWIKRR